MGSEMVSDEDDKKVAAQRKKQHDKRAAYIKADIKKRGIEHVLADIVADRVAYSVHSS
jgi:hypothetical protein